MELQTEAARELFLLNYETALNVATKHALRVGIDIDMATNLAIDRLAKCANRGDNHEETGAPFIGYVEKSIRLDILHMKTTRNINLGEAVEHTTSSQNDGILESIPMMPYIFDFKHRQIYESRRAGFTFQAIGDAFGVGKKRIQIVIKKKKQYLTHMLQLMES